MPRKLLLSALLFSALALGVRGISLAAELRAGAARLDITPASDPANPPTGRYAYYSASHRAR